MNIDIRNSQGRDMVAEVRTSSSALPFLLFLRIALDKQSSTLLKSSVFVLHSRTPQPTIQMVILSQMMAINTFHP